MDDPNADLPIIDHHDAVCSVAADELFLALWGYLRGAGSGRAAGWYARVVDAQPRVAAHTNAPVAGMTTVPGFGVVLSERPHRLRLRGRHHFSQYEIDFQITDRHASGSAIRATTRAEFPGVGGRIYRALVVSTRIHVLVTRGLLRAVIRRAEVLAAGDPDHDDA